MNIAITGMPTFKVRQLFKEASDSLKIYPMNNERCYCFFSGRYALSAAIQALKITTGDNVLIPSYNCGTEIDPFIHNKIGLSFYRIRKDLSVDVRDLIRKIDKSTKAVLLTHYFGFPQPVDQIREICIKNGLFLIEDCAHAFLSEYKNKYLGQFGDVSIFSIRKTIPLPDGGLLVINNQKKEYRPTARTTKPNLFSTYFAAAEIFKEDVSFVENSFTKHCASKITRGSVYNFMLFLRWFIRGSKILLKEDFLSLSYPSSRVFNYKLMNWQISHFSKRIINTSDFAKIREIRRKNFEFVLKWFLDYNSNLLIIKNLPEGVCPLNFPIYLKNRENINRSLRRKGIGSWNWWSFFHPSVPWDEFPEAECLKRNVLILPVHQDLHILHLRKMLEVFDQTVAQGKK